MSFFFLTYNNDTKNPTKISCILQYKVSLLTTVFERIKSVPLFFINKSTQRILYKEKKIVHHLQLMC